MHFCESSDISPFFTWLTMYEYVLMEGAVLERIKREFHVGINEHIILGDLIYSQIGRDALKSLWMEYASIAAENEIPFIATTPTRRVNKERVSYAGYSDKILSDNIDFLGSIKNDCPAKLLVGAMIGCRGDAYTGYGCLSKADSEKFHSWEIDIISSKKVDFIYAALIPCLQEALGIAKCCSGSNIPYIISFAIQDNGCLVDGTSIEDAIKQIDDSVDNAPFCYMFNCVHPNIIRKSLMFIGDNSVKNRIKGVQINASDKSFSDLEKAQRIIASSPESLANDFLRLNHIHHMKIIGGCCGTSFEHMKTIVNRLVNAQA